MPLSHFRLLLFGTTVLAFIWPLLALENRPAQPLVQPEQARTKPWSKIPETANAAEIIDARSRVPILMYHYIRDFKKPHDILGQRLSVSPKNFEQQLLWLKNHGYNTVEPDFLLAPQPRVGQPIILTFDDGYRDGFIYAFPLLKKYQMTGTFFVIVDSLGEPVYLTWAEIKIMKAGGMNIASHTLNHPPLAKLSTKNIEWELTESKRELDLRLNQKTTDFAYPYGSYDQRVVVAAKKAGYKTAVTVNSGTATEKNNRLELPRLRVSDNTNLEELLKVQNFKF